MVNKISLTTPLGFFTMRAAGNVHVYRLEADALRNLSRELVGAGLLQREHRIYWRPTAAQPTSAAHDPPPPPALYLDER